MSNPTSSELLENIPDLTSWEEALLWIEEGQKIIQKLTPNLIAEAEIAFLDWGQIEQKSPSPFGLYTVEKWRKFVLATFLADLISYPKLTDQVDFDRLLFVMHNFPQGFRTWWLKFPNQTWWPVGYTGWYPMFETAFEVFEKRPEKLKNRMVAVNVDKEVTKPLLYLFNYSAAPVLQKSSLTNRLMKQFLQDIDAQNVGGLACITVSEDGVRIASRLGMSCSGYLNCGDHVEGVYTKRI